MTSALILLPRFFSYSAESWNSPEILQLLTKYIRQNLEKKHKVHKSQCSRRYLYIQKDRCSVGTACFLQVSNCLQDNPVQTTKKDTSSISYIEFRTKTKICMRCINELNLVIDFFEAWVCGDPAPEPPSDVGFVRSWPLAKETMLRGVVLLLSSCLGAGKFLLSASLAFFLEPHNAVTLIFLHLSCYAFEISKD